MILTSISLVACGTTWRLSSKQGDVKVDEIETEYLKALRNEQIFLIPIEEILFLQKINASIEQKNGIAFQRVLLHWGELPDDKPAQEVAQEYWIPSNQMLAGNVTGALVKIPITEISELKPWQDEEQ